MNLLPPIKENQLGDIMKKKIICNRGDWEKEYEGEDIDRMRTDAGIDLGLHCAKEHGMDIRKYNIKFITKPNGKN